MYVFRRDNQSLLEHDIMLSSLALPQKINVIFFFNDTATTEIYTLSLHDALPISEFDVALVTPFHRSIPGTLTRCHQRQDRKSTRLNSSHSQISYAVFCLKKKNTAYTYTPTLLLSSSVSSRPPIQSIAHDSTEWQT